MSKVQRLIAAMAVVPKAKKRKTQQKKKRNTNWVLRSCSVSAGDHQVYVDLFEQMVAYVIWWMGLGRFFFGRATARLLTARKNPTAGILSSVGLGTGMHTGLLFLFPHILKVRYRSPALCRVFLLFFHSFFCGVIAWRQRRAAAPSLSLTLTCGLPSATGGAPVPCKR